MQKLNKQPFAVQSFDPPSDPTSTLRLAVGECINLKPEYLRRSPFVFHVPLLFWLVEQLKPASCVTLGSTADTAHFAVCQAVGQLGHDAVCRWVRFTSDGTAQDIDARAFEHHAQRYNTFSDIEKTNSPTDATRFEDGSIDLLVIAKVATSETMAEVRRAWRPKLSPRGVVVMTGAADRSDATFDTAFGCAVEVPVSMSNKATLYFVSDAMAEEFRQAFAGDPSTEPGVLAALKDRGNDMQQALEHWDAIPVIGDVSNDLGGRHADELSALVGSIARRDKQISELHKMLSQYGDAPRLNNDQRRELIILSQKLNDALLAIGERDATLEEERTAKRECEAKLEKMYKSTSWRISAPIRAIGRLLGR